MEHVAMKFEDTPDYKRLKRILEKDMQAAYFKFDGRLLFKPPMASWRNSSSPKKKLVLQEIVLPEDSADECESESTAEKPTAAKVALSHAVPARKKNRRLPAATKSASELGSLAKWDPEPEMVKKKEASSLSSWTSSND
ncbi:uncharacterized protein [Dermacentor albipictus]|uniref:uncharacterized protein n=1 Tax=Dermacentor albipictus TaxID=60249 RepID=UPI0038FC09BE